MLDGKPNRNGSLLVYLTISFQCAKYYDKENVLHKYTNGLRSFTMASAKCSRSQITILICGFIHIIILIAAICEIAFMTEKIACECESDYLPNAHAAGTGGS